MAEPAKRFRSSYLEKDFTAEVTRFLMPAREERRENGKKVFGEGHYPGPGWLAHRIVDQPWIPDATRVQQKKPFDLWFCAGVELASGKRLAEFHALELKLVPNSQTLGFGKLDSHQWDNLALAEEQGFNAYGWALVMFRLDKRATAGAIEKLFAMQTVFAVRAAHMLAMRAAGQRSVTVEALRTFDPALGRPLGIQLRQALVHPWKTSKAGRLAWDLTPLLRGGHQTPKQAMKETA